MNSQALAGHWWWLASRASGLVALGLITISVIIGLSLAGRITRKPGLPAKLSALHEQTALAGLIAIAVHGLTLLGDAWLAPGPIGISVPFAMAYKPLWTGLGIIGGYLAAALGLSFYVRRSIGPKLWRKAHRATIVVYGLAVAHTLGAGTDASSPALRWWFAVTVPIVVILLGARMLGVGKSRPKSRPAPRPAVRSLPHGAPRRPEPLEETS